MNRKRIEELEKQIAELRSRWPAHSVPPAMLQQLDELEEELDQAREHTTEEDSNAEAGRDGRLRAFSTRTWR